MQCLSDFCTAAEIQKDHQPFVTVVCTLVGWAIMEGWYNEPENTWEGFALKKYFSSFETASCYATFWAVSNELTYIPREGGNKR